MNCRGDTEVVNARGRATHTDMECSGKSGHLPHKGGEEGVLGGGVLLPILRFKDDPGPRAVERQAMQNRTRASSGYGAVEMWRRRVTNFHPNNLQVPAKQCSSQGVSVGVRNGAVTRARARASSVDGLGVGLGLRSRARARVTDRISVQGRATVGRCFCLLQCAMLPSFEHLLLPNSHHKIQPIPLSGVHFCAGASWPHIPPPPSQTHGHEATPALPN